MRATAVAATGALALGALAVPAAHATEGGPYALDVTFSNTKINGGSTVAVGTTTPKKAAVTFTLKHGADVDIHASDFVVGVDLYRGASLDERTSTLESAEAACTDSATAPATVATCTATVTVDPADLRNADAGVWKTGLHAVAYNGQDRNDLRDPGRIGGRAARQRQGLRAPALRQADRERLAGAGQEGQDHHGHRPAQPRQLGRRQVPRLLLQRVREAGVPEEVRDVLHPGPEHQRGHRRPSGDDDHRHGRRLLPLHLPRQLDHPAGQLPGRLRRRAVSRTGPAPGAPVTARDRDREKIRPEIALAVQPAVCLVDLTVRVDRLHDHFSLQGNAHAHTCHRGRRLRRPGPLRSRRPGRARHR
ncbi:hypothetical protein LT493_14610 [Streptomyces tricolor]|nr:hypothetical protein [Streptomyces tricolor]